jgi:hypothetical protein
MLWLFLGLKIPLLAACWLVWWAIRQEPEPDDDPRPNGDGGQRVRPAARDPRHPRPKLPHAPRRGPHAEAPPPSPPRVRPVDARARSKLGSTDHRG